MACNARGEPLTLCLFCVFSMQCSCLLRDWTGFAAAPSTFFLQNIRWAAQWCVPLTWCAQEMGFWGKLWPFKGALGLMLNFGAQQGKCQSSRPHPSAQCAYAVYGGSLFEFLFSWAGKPTPHPTPVVNATLTLCPLCLLSRNVLGRGSQWPLGGKLETLGFCNAASHLFFYN